jgi:predicted dehydrogenase
MEFAFYSPERRLTLSFPSPFLRSMPTLLISEDGNAPTPQATVTQEVVSYEESFKRELVHFHECIETGRTPTTSAADSLHDIALCEAVVAVHRSRQPRSRPAEPAMATA